MIILIKRDKKDTNILNYIIETKCSCDLDQISDRSSNSDNLNKKQELYCDTGRVDETEIIDTYIKAFTNKTEDDDKGIWYLLKNHDLFSLFYKIDPFHCRTIRCTLLFVLGYINI